MSKKEVKESNPTTPAISIVRDSTGRWNFVVVQYDLVSQTALLEKVTPLATKDEAVDEFRKFAATQLLYRNE